MSLPNRRSSILNIDDWLDKCSNSEPDSMIYEPDYCNEMAVMRTKNKEPEIEGLYKIVADMCTKIGLPPEIVEERLNDIDDCISSFVSTIQKDVQDEYDKLCHYRQDLLNQIQKMTSDLYLPPYVSDDNVTLLQNCKRLKTRFIELNAIKEKRLKRLQELRDKQSRHCLIMGIKTPELKLQTDIPTDDELSKLACVVSDLEKEEKRRKDKYNLLKDMISKCMTQLEYKPKNEFEQGILSDNPCYTEDHLMRMSNLHSHLEAQYASNLEKYNNLKETLISLYDRLDVAQEERDEFLESHQVCKPSSILEMEVEIEQYEELKRKNIGKFIQKMKDELEVEYEKCYMSQEQQDNFFSLSTVSGECSEEILELYERELERIKKFYNDNQEMFEKFQKWRMMWKELIELEVKASDPNRFNNRGGQLLLEERKRKALQKNLPKVERELLDMNEKYAAKNNGSKFKIFDSTIDEFVAGCWDELNAAKEEEKRERQRAKNNEPAGIKGRKPMPTQGIAKKTPTKRAAGPGITPTPSKLQCQRSILGTPSQNTFRVNQQIASGSVRKIPQRNVAPSVTHADSKNKQLSNSKSNIPVLGGQKDKTSSNSNGSDFSALSLSEQEFEDIIVTCPASAKRAR